MQSVFKAALKLPYLWDLSFTQKEMYRDVSILFVNELNCLFLDEWSFSVGGQLFF